MRTYILKRKLYPDSYINDLELMLKQLKNLPKDSRHTGLILLDIDSGRDHKCVSEHESTSARIEVPI
jgi:hypothetical protein